MNPHLCFALLLILAGLALVGLSGSPDLPDRFVDAPASAIVSAAAIAGLPRN